MTRRPALRTTLPGKHAMAAAIDPAEHATYVRSRCPGATLAHTAGAVLVHQNSLLRHALAAHPAAQLRTGWASADLHLLKHRGQTVALCSGIGAGAPATALVTEQLTALGVPAVISIGTAAALIPALRPGDLVLCEKALRGEGTSRHYLPPSLFAHPDPQLTASLATALSGIGATWTRGPAWTTDALYRESAAEADLYAQHGILTVEMEAAGLFAVGHHRHLPTAAAFATADCLVNRTPRADSPRLGAALQQLLVAALDAFTGRGPSPDAARPYTVVPHHEAEQEPHCG
ncbi:nucleoside phosphorylase [Streptomyces sp. LaPpAH-108]|uniref:nucleoside phosphorylase n=1 Tax=Streptomyces sp. LaPpAH-108 TaxID=1155714 RepID=UPI00037C7187|nr:nucleoside phosphorylase [Streptomyces sp. LaPpAH-108]